jgi:hypothetical protein
MVLSSFWQPNRIKLATNRKIDFLISNTRFTNEKIKLFVFAFFLLK